MDNKDLEKIEQELASSAFSLVRLQFNWFKLVLRWTACFVRWLLVRLELSLLSLVCFAGCLFARISLSLRRIAYKTVMAVCRLCGADT